MPAFSEWINLYKWSTGRRKYGMGRVRRVADELGDGDLVARADDALAHELSTLEKERLWQIARQEQNSGRGNAVKLDNQLDRIVSGMFASVSSLRGALDEGSELAQRCGAFLDTYFPEGPAGITKREFEEQLGAMQEILRHIQAIPADQAAEMHVTPFSDQLARLLPVFEAELAQPGEQFRFDILRAAREVGHENLCALTAAILAGYSGRDPERVEKRNRLLAPIVEQNERVRVRMARRPAPDVAVDPETGRELVEPVEDLDPVADDDPAEPREPVDPTEPTS